MNPFLLALSQLFMICLFIPLFSPRINANTLETAQYNVAIKTTHCYAQAPKYSSDTLPATANTPVGNINTEREQK